MGDATLSTLARGSTMRALEAESFDLIVIGGGITGAGVARDATRRGLKVALLEAEDFASGTSSRSAKLLHGGLRYLEHGEVGLVRQTALERKEIHRVAPHLSEPRWMVIPVTGLPLLYSLRMAVTVYEKLGAVAEADEHRSWDVAELAEHEPLLNRHVFPHALAYREYVTDDARLVLVNLRSAAAGGALVLNHAPVVGLLRNGEQAIGVEAQCRLTGERFVARGRVIVNATGPWVEALQKLENPDAMPLLQLSKGIHVSLSAAKVPVRNLLVLGAQDKRRIFMVRRGEVVYVGTTDNSYARGAEVWPQIERGEVDYLLEPLPRYLDCGPISRGDVIGAWAGLRPLIADPSKHSTTELSRRDELFVGPLGVISVAGGKLTGYRAMARRVLDAVAERLHRSLPEPPDEPPLPGGDFDGDLEALAARLQRAHALDEHTAGRLARLFGTEAEGVLALGSAAIYTGADCVVGEVRWAVEQEGAVELEDLFHRRTRLPVYGLEPARAIEPLAAAMGAVLGWDEARRQTEAERARRRLELDLSFT